MKTVIEKLMNYSPEDISNPTRLTVYLHSLTEAQRKELQDLYKAGLLKLHNHKDELQAVLACENVHRGIRWDESRKPYRPASTKVDGPAKSMDIESAFKSIRNI